MQLRWRLFTHCTSEKSAIKVAQKHFELIRLAIESVVAEPYHKGGFLVIAQCELSSASWACFVVDAIALAQRAGRGWLLLGAITEELDAWSNEPTTPGISSMHVQAIRSSVD